MKYQILEYNANQPIMKQLTVPLESEFGIAVKVTKDGEQLELSSSDVTVGGIQASDVRGGYVLADLSSGSAPSLYRADISISADGGFTTTFPLQVQAKDLGYFEV